MSIEKNYLKSKPVCKVKFVLPKDQFNGAKKVSLVGEFNGWDTEAQPMKKQKTGDYATTLDLAPGHEYAFRYLIDDSAWENDGAADKYIPSYVCEAENSVVIV